jgi:hypothetical protein
MNDLDALFGSVDGLKEDIMEYGTIAGAAVMANVGWNMALAKFVPSDLNPSLRQYGLPAVAIVGGIALGRAVARTNRRVGLGVTIGLVSAGISSLVRSFVPGVPMAGLGSYRRGFGRAPMMTEDVSGIGAPVSIEDLSGAPATIEDMSQVDGLSATMTAGGF